MRSTTSRSSQVQATLPTNGFPWDAYHVNSIDLSPDGRSFLVSMRDTWAVYLVDIASGRIEWTLGGRSSSFRFGAGAAFAVAARRAARAATRRSRCSTTTAASSPAAAATSNRKRPRARSCSSSTSGGAPRRSSASSASGFRLESEYMGDTQPLPGGNVFIGWGSEPYISEFSATGKLLWEAELPGPDLSYRATLEQWVGAPLSPPAGAARRSGSARRRSTRAGTEPRSSPRGGCWRARGRPRRLPWQPPRAPDSRRRCPVTGSYTRFEVQALDAHGHVLGTSAPFAPGA